MRSQDSAATHKVNYRYRFLLRPNQNAIVVPKNQEITELLDDIREQLGYMRELGVTSLEAKLPQVIVPTLEIAAGTKSSEQFAPPPPNSVSVGDTAKTERVAGSRLSELPSLSQRKSTQFFD